MRGYNFTHMPTRFSMFGGHRILHVRSDCGRNQTCQISSESVQGFQSPRGRKWPSSIDLAHRPYNKDETCNQQAAGSTVNLPTAHDLQQLGNLLCDEADWASHPHSQSLVTYAWQGEGQPNAAHWSWLCNKSGDAGVDPFWSRMSLSRVHTSAKTADRTKLLPSNKQWMSSCAVGLNAQERWQCTDS